MDFSSFFSDKDTKQAASSPSYVIANRMVQQTALSARFFFQELKSNFASRIWVYAGGAVILLVLLLLNNLSYLGLNIETWFIMVAIIVIIDIITSILDTLAFHLLSYLPNKRAYVLQSLKYLPGLIATILLSDRYAVRAVVRKSDTSSEQQFIQLSSWHLYLTMIIIVIILLAIKRLFEARNYEQVLEVRYRDKLILLDLKLQILSHLACLAMEKKRTSKLQHQQSQQLFGNSNAGIGIAEVNVNFDESKSNSPIPTTVNTTTPSTTTARATWGSWVRGMFGRENAADTRSPTTSNADIADNKSKNSSTTYVPVTTSHEHEDKHATTDETLDRALAGDLFLDVTREDFWDRVNRLVLHHYAVRIRTRNGILRIEDKPTAEKFGEMLYQHLLNICKDHVEYTRVRLDDTVVVSGLKSTLTGSGNEVNEVSSIIIREVLLAMLRRHTTLYGDTGFRPHSLSIAPRANRAFTTTNYASANQADVSQPPSRYMGNGVIAYTSSDKTLVWSADDETKLLCELLQTDECGTITLDKCKSAVTSVFEEWSAIRSSFVGYDYVNSTLFKIFDVFFWIIILIMVSVYFQNSSINTILLPFMTMILMFSFALGPILGNLTLAAAFVFFMLPYDIGHRIGIGPSPEGRKIGFVREITLLYTTIQTTQNEKIINFFDSGGCRYTISVEFSIGHHLTGWNMNKINSFLEQVKNYVKVENGDRWEDCWIICDHYDISRNVVKYTFWLTHRLPRQTGISYDDKIKFLAFLVDLQGKMGYCVSQAYQPIHIYKQTGGGDGVWQ